MAKIIDGLVLNGQPYEFAATDTNLADIETDQGAASKPYAVGDHLILDGQYYVVTEPIAENDSLVVDSNIRIKSVGNEIAQLNNDLAPLKKGAGHVANKDLNTLTEAGTYLCLANCTNLPNTTEWFTVNVFVGGTGSFIQQAIGATSDTMYYRHNDGTKWSNWRRNFNFGIDANGNYGYIKDGADTVTPFKTTNFKYLGWYRGNVDVKSSLPNVYSKLSRSNFIIQPGDANNNLDQLANFYNQSSYTGIAFYLNTSYNASNGILSVYPYAVCSRRNSTIDHVSVDIAANVYVYW